MTSSKHIKIQIWKFSFYGLFKNLRFFDPFLLLYLLENNMSVTLIMTLYAVREAIVYIFEIPSGVIADRYGKKTELVICFMFYIISFVLFFIGGSYSVFALAFMLFGFGEAFRSGTHKAMIMEFLDYHELTTDKSKIYGLTRSYSMIGSAISSLVSVVLVFFIPELKFLFLLAIIPYILDLLLILTYPSYLNRKLDTKFKLKDFIKSITDVIVYFGKQNRLRVTILNSASYNAIYKVIKDYIQPIISVLLIGIILFDQIDQEANIRVMIGLIYVGVYVASSIASRYSNLFLNFKNKDQIIKLTWLLLAFTSLLFNTFESQIFAVIVIFVLFYVLQNIRKPIMIEKIGDCVDKNKRASILSIESQLTSLIIIFMAPIFGLVYDYLGVQYVFYGIALISIIFFIIAPKELDI